MWLPLRCDDVAPQVLQCCKVFGDLFVCSCLSALAARHGVVVRRCVLAHKQLGLGNAERLLMCDLTQYAGRSHV